MYAPGKFLIPLTINCVRDRYWDATAYGNIEHFACNSNATRLKIASVIDQDNSVSLVVEENDGENQQTVSAKYFQPNGDMMECMFPGFGIFMHKNWLQGNSPGPYLPNQTLPFYHLLGTVDGGVAQVGPNNVLSYDTSGTIKFWVLE